MTSVARNGRILLAAILMLSLVGIHAAKADWDSDPYNLNVITDQHYLCGHDDLPEGDIQGDVPKADQDSRRAEQGYNCGLALVGHATLTEDFGDGYGPRPRTGNANMGWAGKCAYVAGPGGGIAPQAYTPPAPANGVAVVDVHDSAHPTHVATLRTPGAAAVSETLNSVTTPDGRSILVVGQYGNDAVKTGPKPMDIYDVSDPDCTKFRLMATFDWPTNIHNLTISQNGRYVFATNHLSAVDISGLWDDDPNTGVVYLGDIRGAIDSSPVAVGPSADVTGPLYEQVPAPLEGNTTHAVVMDHEAWPSPDGTTLYVGGQTPAYEMFTIIDLTDWLQRSADGTPAGPPHVISQQSGRGHSIRTATINGAPYILHSEESVFGTAYSCIPETANPFAGPAQPWLTDISDPTHPHTVSQFGLEINNLSNCPEQLDSKANQSVHYHDVDDPNDTTFVMASMLNGGLRVFDVTNPARPAEVAYFNPGDVDPSSTTLLDRAWAHSRYVKETGEIWLATGNGGFWVVRLENQVRKYLRLRHDSHGTATPDVPVSDPGHPGTAGAALPALDAVPIDPTPYYCTFSTVTAPVPG